MRSSRPPRGGTPGHAVGGRSLSPGCWDPRGALGQGAWAPSSTL